MGSGRYGGGSGVGKVNVNDVSIMKKVDKASADLFLASAPGNTYRQREAIRVRKAGGDSPLEYLTYEMNEVFVSSVNKATRSGGDGIAQESISLNFSKIKVTYTPQRAQEDAGRSIPKWSIRKRMRT